MEPLSKTWHLSIHNEHPTFRNKHIDYINKIKLKEEDGFSYIPSGNNNQNYYGGGNIYVQEKTGDASHFPWGRYIEMNGELVPVRNSKHVGAGVLYEVYDVKSPSEKGHQIEWDGNRWIFERKTSVHVSKDLKHRIQPEMISEKVNAGKISAPDHQGLRYDVDGKRYIKIKDVNIRARKFGENYFIIKTNSEKIHLQERNGKFHSENQRHRISRIKNNGLNGKNQKPYQLIAET